jgi:hypothetical protein
MQEMTINQLVTVELAFEAVQQNCGVGSLPIDVIESLAFEGMVVWTWSRVLLIELTWELKIQGSFLKKLSILIGSLYALQSQRNRRLSCNRSFNLY